MTLDYERVERRRKAPWVLWVLPVSLGLLLGAALLLPRHRGHGSLNAQCGRNLRQIGIAVLIYAADPQNNGRFPDTLEDVLRTQAIDADAFLCPASSDSPSPGGSPEERARKLLGGGHCTFIYLGKGLTNKTADDTPIAYEPLTSHSEQQKGSNVLYADGHVSLVSEDDLPAVLKRAGSASRPTTVPSP